jgi:hypothetical protein
MSHGKTNLFAILGRSGDENSNLGDMVVPSQAWNSNVIHLGCDDII